MLTAPFFVFDAYVNWFVWLAGPQSHPWDDLLQMISCNLYVINAWSANGICDLKAPKKKAEKMSLNDFLGNAGMHIILAKQRFTQVSTDFGSWADEMEDFPTAREYTFVSRVWRIHWVPL